MSQQQQKGGEKQTVRVQAASFSNPKKYLMHFQSINKPVRIPSNFMTVNSSTKNKFNNALEMYSSSISTIDKIANSPVNQPQNNYMGEQEHNDYVSIPMIINLNNKIKQKVHSINNFFNRNFNDHLFQNNQEYDGTLNGYIQNIINIDISNTLFMPELHQIRRRSQSNSKSKSKQSGKFKNGQKNQAIPAQSTPISKNQVHQVQVNTDPIQLSQKTNNKLKKMDLILVQIMRQKKRKGLVPDYYRAIQMKLVELLEYILHDQPDYFGLALVDKMKEVLKNLQSFKGKTIDGELKVNMLRIFFQQFRNLKKQRQQQGLSRQNKSRSHSKKSKSKIQQNKVGVKQQSSAFANFKNKKSFDTFSVGGNRGQNKNPPKNPSTKSVKQEDQWIGSLDT